MLPRVLVVSKSARLREQFVQWLNDAGHQSVARADFPSARHELDAAPPELLITDVRLDAYNGLHLVIWTRGRGMPTKSIIIGEPDPVLQREADREGAAYLSPPFEQREFVATVGAILARYHPIRRSPRKVVRLDAVVDGLTGAVIDLSYEGLRLELPELDAVTLPQFFTIQLPEFGVACRLQRIWTRHSPAAPWTLRCGAVLPMPDSEIASVWRHLVDAVPERAPRLPQTTVEG